MPRYFNIAGPCIPGEHYMLPARERCLGAAEGWLVVFDQRSAHSGDERIYVKDEAAPGGKVIHVIGA